MFFPSITLSAQCKLETPIRWNVLVVEMNIRCSQTICVCLVDLTYLSRIYARLVYRHEVHEDPALLMGSSPF
eukprot:c19110_g1_i1 orf=430-645(+)